MPRHSGGIVVGIDPAAKQPAPLAVGIDPGLKGGLARLAARPGAVPEAIRMPVLPAGGLDLPAVVAWLDWCVAFSGRQVLCVIEEASTRPKQSAQSGLTTGTNYGALLGVLAALEVPHTVVRPQVWQHAVGVPPCRRPLLGDDGVQLRTRSGRGRTTTDRRAKKAAVVRLVQERWPQVDLMPGRCTTPQDGMADAVALAWFASMRMGAA